MQPVIKPSETFKFSIITWVLDMREQTDLLGKELAELITRSVAATQKGILRPLPDWLILSHKQFASLLDFTEPIDDVEGRIFITKYNVMEVDVDLDLDPMEEVLMPGTEFDYNGMPQGGRFSQ